MPLAAYFRNVGAALLALLLLTDYYLPTTPVVQSAAADPPVIRIHSGRKMSEPVVFDTTQLVFAAATPSPWDSNPPAPPAPRAGASGARDAFALLPGTDPHRAASADQKKRPLNRKYAARNHAKPEIVLATRQGQFPWFGFRNW